MPGHPQPIRVLLVDSRPLVLMGLDKLINAHKPQMAVCGQATSYANALDLADQLHPHVTLFSFFPDALDPVTVITELAQADETRVLVLKGLYENAPIGRALGAGARGVVLAEDPTESITRAITRVHRRATGLNRAWTGGLSGYASARHVPVNGDSEQPRIARLTLREKELIRVIVGDPSAKYMTVAARLGISEHTVHNHLSSIYQKLNLINRIDLLVYALKNGLADPDEAPDSRWMDWH